MSDKEDFFQTLSKLSNSYTEQYLYKSTLEKEIERLLKDNKEKDKIIEQQRKELEALKQKKNRYIEVEDKDRIIIYDTREDKFTWRTYWSQLPSNIIDDLYQNELSNYYKKKVLKVVRNGQKLTGENWYERNFHSNYSHRQGFKVDLNSEFSIPLLYQIQEVRGELRNLANKPEIAIDKHDTIYNYLHTHNDYDRCIGYTQSGERCKCRGIHNIFNHFKKEDKALWFYLQIYKNLPTMYICGRHSKTAEKDFTELVIWISTFLDIHYDIILVNEKEDMIKKLFSDLSFNEYREKNIQ
jgi:hypothetical protein